MTDLLSIQLLKDYEEVFPAGIGKWCPLPEWVGGTLERRLAESRWVGTEIENFLPGSEDKESG